MEAKNLIKWNEVSIILTGNPSTVRSDRLNKKHADKIDALLDYVQKWIDKKGNVKQATVTIKVKEPMESVVLEEAVVPKIDKKQYYVSVDKLPDDRQIYTADGYRGLYVSGKKFYTNKVKNGKLDIREWSKIEKAKEYLDSLK